MLKAENVATHGHVVRLWWNIFFSILHGKVYYCKSKQDEKVTVFPLNINKSPTHKISFHL